MLHDWKWVGWEGAILRLNAAKKLSNSKTVLFSHLIREETHVLPNCCYQHPYNQDLLADLGGILIAADCDRLFIVCVCGCVSVKGECDCVCVCGQWQMASLCPPKTQIMITVHLWRLQINPLSPAVVEPPRPDADSYLPPPALRHADSSYQNNVLWQYITFI